jgi:hypothetical protein
MSYALATQYADKAAKKATAAATQAYGEHRQKLLSEAVAYLAQAVMSMCQAEMADT